MLRKMPKVDSFLLFLYTFSFFFTGIPVWRRGTRSSNLHWHFLCFFPFLILLISKSDSWKSMLKRIILPSWKLTFFVLYSLVLFFYSAFDYGFTNTIVSMIYSFVVITVIYSLYRNYSIKDIQEVIVRAYLVALVIILIHAAFQAAAILSFLREGGVHPEIETLVRGGVNIEASLCGMFAVFTMRKRYGMIVWYISLSISAMYSSRAGIVINLMVMTWYLVFVKGLNMKTMITILPAIVIMFAVMIYSSAGSIVIERFANTVEDGGSGRDKIWQHALEVIKQYPLGVGCGNVMYAIEKVNNVVHGENNAHNIYIQYVTEHGVIFGLLFLIVSIQWVLGYEFRRRFQNPFGVFILIYFVQGLVQSTGVDTWVTVVAGSYFISRWQEKLGIFSAEFNIPHGKKHGREMIKS